MRLGRAHSGYVPVVPGLGRAHFSLAPSLSVGKASAKWPGTKCSPYERSQSHRFESITLMVVVHQ